MSSHPDLEIIDARPVAYERFTRQKTDAEVAAFQEAEALKRSSAAEAAKARAAASAKIAEQEAAQKYERDRMVVDGALADVFGSDPHPEIDELDRRACVQWLADRFREQIEAARNRRRAMAAFAPRPARREVDATQPIDGGLLVELDGKRDIAEVCIDGVTYVLGRGTNYIPADATDIGELDSLVASGVATLRAPGGAT